MRKLPFILLFFAITFGGTQCFAYTYYWYFLDFSIVADTNIGIPAISGTLQVVASPDDPGWSGGKMDVGLTSLSPSSNSSFPNSTTAYLAVQYYYTDPGYGNWNSAGAGQAAVIGSLTSSGQTITSAGSAFYNTGGSHMNSSTNHYLAFSLQGGTGGYNSNFNGSSRLYNYKVPYTVSLPLPTSSNHNSHITASSLTNGGGNPDYSTVIVTVTSAQTTSLGVQAAWGLSTSANPTILFGGLVEPHYAVILSPGQSFTWTKSVFTGSGSSWPSYSLVASAYKLNSVPFWSDPADAVDSQGRVDPSASYLFQINKSDYLGSGTAVPIYSGSNAGTVTPDLNNTVYNPVTQGINSPNPAAPDRQLSTAATSGITNSSAATGTDLQKGFDASIKANRDGTNAVIGAVSSTNQLLSSINTKLSGTLTTSGGGGGGSTTNTEALNSAANSAISSNPGSGVASGQGTTAGTALGGALPTSSGLSAYTWITPGEPDMSIELPTGISSTVTVDFNPLHNTLAANLFAVFKAAMYWLIVYLFAIYAYKEVKAYVFHLGETNQAIGNAIAAGSGGQATALASATLITTIIYTAVVAIVAAIGSSFLSISSMYTALGGDPISGLGAIPVYLIDACLPVAAILSYAIGRLVFGWTALGASGVASTIIRYVTF